jgi:exodeoxyribonuclease VII large subunit
LSNIMEYAGSDKRPYRLHELSTAIKSVVSSAFPDACWVIAEIAECKCNQKGHCYLELVEKEDERTIAQMKATIWAYDYRNISGRFEKTTGETLKRGMKILLLAAVTFHEVYGLSLAVKDIDPTFTLGEMERRKKEVIRRLTEEGVIARNKGLPLPLVPQRIAVVSSPTAAGYGDFLTQLDSNLYGYKFTRVLFPATMQGDDAENSIISALDGIRRKKGIFDAVVIIRGGGSAVDLSCFDSYAVARAIALFPLPVVTGIGHERDDTVADIVAHTRMKTPTAVAEFFISGVRSYEETVIDMQERLRVCAQNLLRDENHKVDALIRGLGYVPLRLAAEHRTRIAMLHTELAGLLREFLSKEDSRFKTLEQALRHLDPENVLRRGFSITRCKGAVVRDAASLRKWAVIETTLAKGVVTSIVQDRKEEKKIGQSQTDNLLPGFE